MKHKNIIKACLILSSMLTIMTGTIITPSLQQISEVFKDIPNIELLSRMIITIPALLIAFASPVLGHFADKYGRKNIFLYSLLLYAISGSTGYFFNNIYIILIGRALLGVSVGGLLTIGFTLIGDYFEGDERNSFTGIQGAFMGLSGIIFSPLGGWLSGFSWQLPFIVYLLSLPVFFLVLIYVYEPKLNIKENNQSNKTKNLKGNENYKNSNKTENIYNTKNINNTEDIKANEAYSNPKDSQNYRESEDYKNSRASIKVSTAKYNTKLVRLIYFLTFISIIAFFLIPVQIPFYLQKFEGMNTSKIGLAMSLMSIGVTVVSFNYGKITKLISSFKHIFQIGFLFMALGFLFIYFSSSFTIALIGLFVSGLGFGFFLPAANLWMIQVAPQTLRGSLLGRVSMYTYLGQFFSPIIMQPFINIYGVGAAYLASAAALIMISIVLIFFKTEKNTITT